MPPGVATYFFAIAIAAAILAVTWILRARSKGPRAYTMAGACGGLGISALFMGMEMPPPVISIGFLVMALCLVGDIMIRRARS
ncbi:MAG: hypothetical protein JNM85_08855 [Chthonomonas sp.]|nr:hypothetical protein [Chthonomonas sp.]